MPFWCGRLRLVEGSSAGRGRLFMVKRDGVGGIEGHGDGRCGQSCGTWFLVDLRMHRLASLSVAMAPTSGAPGHDEVGEVLADLAVTMRFVAAVRFWRRRGRPVLFGQIVASRRWRTSPRSMSCFDEIRPAPGSSECLGSGQGMSFYVIDIDATLIGAHSDRNSGADMEAGFSSIRCWLLDATGGGPGCGCCDRQRGSGRPRSRRVSLTRSPSSRSILPTR